MKNQKLIIGILAGIVVIGGGIWAYKKYYSSESKEKNFQPVGGKSLDMKNDAVANKVVKQKMNNYVANVASDRNLKAKFDKFATA